jgi:hypothetical protein
MAMGFVHQHALSGGAVIGMTEQCLDALSDVRERRSRKGPAQTLRGVCGAALGLARGRFASLRFAEFMQSCR